MFNWNKKKIEDLEWTVTRLANSLDEQRGRINKLNSENKSLTDRVERVGQDSLDNYRRSRWIDENPRKYKKGDVVKYAYYPHAASTGSEGIGRVMSYLITTDRGDYYWEYKVINCETMDTNIFNEASLSLCKK
tara:strand:- start:4251 stop:4649 length:399 start_codon:yes stop_codon:yes gene_type:complete